MQVSAEKIGVSCFKESFYFCCELLMLLHRESVSNVMDLVVTEKPLFVSESDEAFN
jgi:hypothetical protein